MPLDRWTDDHISFIEEKCPFCIHCVNGLPAGYSSPKSGDKPMEGLCLRGPSVVLDKHSIKEVRQT